VRTEGWRRGVLFIARSKRAGLGEPVDAFAGTVVDAQYPPAGVTWGVLLSLRPAHGMLNRLGVSGYALSVALIEN